MVSLLVLLLLQDAVLRVGNGVSAPTLLEKYEPEYSELARRAKIQSTVLLYLEIHADGRAHNIRIQTPSSDAGLDRQAIKAIETWRFRPGMKNGGAVPVASNIEVNFKLLKTAVNTKLTGKVYRAAAKTGNADAQYGLGVIAYDARKFDEARQVVRAGRRAGTLPGGVPPRQSVSERRRRCSRPGRGADLFKNRPRTRIIIWERCCIRH